MAAIARLALIYPLDLRSHRQILARTDAQAAYFMGAGIDVRVYSFDRGHAGALMPHHRVVRSFAPAQARLFMDIGQLQRALQQFGPDVAVMRFGLATGGIARIASQFPLVLEIHTDDSVERPRGGARGAAARLSSALSRQELLKNIAGAVFVSTELSRLEGYRQIETKTVITNGISLPAQALSAPHNVRPVVGYAVGYDAPWQGVDRLAELARRLPDIDFHLISSDRAVAAPEGSSTNLQTIHPRNSVEYGRQLALLDASLGTLAVDRKGLTMSASLKVRESISLGIPTFLVSIDEDLIDASDPAVATALGLARDPEELARRLGAFVQRTRGGRVSEETMRRVDIATKSQQYLEFLASIHHRRSGTPSAS